MPLEQLLALYGYAPSTTTNTDDKSTDTHSGEDHTHTNKDHTKLPESSPSIRSRRRNRVVPLQPQKQPAPDAIDEPTTSSSKEGLPGRVSEMENTAASHTGSEVGGRLSGDTLTSEEMAANMEIGEVADQKVSKGVEQEARKGAEQEARREEMAANMEVGEVADQKVSKGVEQEARRATEQKARKEMEVKPKRSEQEVTKGVEPAKGKRREGQEDTDIEEVDVVEVGEMEFGLGSRRHEEETVLSMDQLQRAEFDVVRMGDIEAGLRIDGGTLGELEEAELSGSEGAYREYEEVGLEDREGEEGMAEMEEMGRDLQERTSNAVYDDVLLSSGNARLLSDTTGITLIG